MTRAVRLAHDVALPAGDAFALVADVRSHARWVPLTRVETVPSPTSGPGDPVDPWLPGVGAEFAVVTGPGARRGAPAFVDRMRITTWQPPSTTATSVGTSAHAGPETTQHRPGLAVYRKLGPVLLGTAGFEVCPTSPTTSRVVWWEDVHVTDLLPASWTSPVANVVLRGLIRAAWRRLDREAQALADGRAQASVASSDDVPDASSEPSAGSDAAAGASPASTR